MRRGSPSINALVALVRRTKIDEAKGERWFCDEAEAQEAGWRGRSSKCEELRPEPPGHAPASAFVAVRVRHELCGSGDPSSPAGSQLYPCRRSICRPALAAAAAANRRAQRTGPGLNPIARLAAELVDQLRCYGLQLPLLGERSHASQNCTTCHALRPCPGVESGVGGDRPQCPKRKPVKARREPARLTQDPYAAAFVRVRLAFGAGATGFLRPRPMFLASSWRVLAQG